MGETLVMVVEGIPGPFFYSLASIWHLKQESSTKLERDQPRRGKRLLPTSYIVGLTSTTPDANFSDKQLVPCKTDSAGMEGMATTQRGRVW